jgi:polar amino acid transport system substrate-binding protein
VKKWIVLVSLLFATTADAQTLKLLTEEYPPYSYREEGIYKGASVDQVKLIMKDVGIAYTIEMMPWARALALTETQDMTCIFSTVHNAERDKRFKWVEPLLIDRTVLIRKRGSQVNPATPADAAKFIVGTQRGDFTVDILKAKNFTKLDLASDLTLTLKKLINGRIDLMPISEKYYDKLRREGVDVENVMVLTEQVNSLACNKSVPDEDIRKMQASLTKLIDKGMQDALFHKYGLDLQSN